MPRKGANVSEIQYKALYTVEQRTREAEEARAKNKNRVPIICENADDSDISGLQITKYLLQPDITIGQLLLQLRKRMRVSSEKAIFLFISGSVPPSTAQISDLYVHHKDEDGFLYIKYTLEATLG
ncbi:microtubule-associated protein 1A/1B, light chain 3 [Trypanosoma grayi]|uniref:microtubule-associated protein 1A/1B, light chain 3 n=1 Tax=Trypanosoma grayi TaxID=71804 RepID=UPI0004F3FFC2|nr:microtubule-associated protein 1A/1B, light chain 3 [Trypanosoma grayi]KEG13974.1 microtubule-associated protein 1A/1B, light chain 3 [Trypanosoma grayi]